MSMVDARLRWMKKISIKVHGSDINLLTSMQPLLKSAQADIIPAPRLSYNDEQDEQGNNGGGSGNGAYDPSMSGSLYDENGNDLLALENDMHLDALQNGSYANNALSNTDASINDNCLPLGLSIYEEYGIANVGLSEHWRIYPNDDNSQQLKSMVSEDNLHFYYS